MKYSTVVAATFAGAVYAQQLPQPEGDCAQMCASNMNRIAQQNYSCAADDLGCFCNESNWAYGIRDCSNEACDPQQALSAQAWAAARCAGVAATASQPPNGLPILTSAIASASQAVDNGDDDNNTATATTVITSVVPSATTDADGLPITSLVSSASEEIASAASSISSAFASVTSSVAEDLSEAVSSATDDADNVVSTISSAVATVTSEAGDVLSTVTDEAGNVVSTLTNAAGDAAATASDAVDGGDEEGAAPQMTAVPFAAGLGLAAWLLI